MKFASLICDPRGEVSEAKVWANIFKAAMTFVFLAHAEGVIKDWTVLSVFVCGVIAPDVLKKMLMLRAGKGPLDEGQTEVRSRVSSGPGGNNDTDRSLSVRVDTSNKRGV